MTLLQVSLFGLIGALIGGLLSKTIHRLRAHERLVVMRTGRYMGPLGPGMAFTVPLVDKTYRIDLREQSLILPPEPVTTHDKAALEVDLEIRYRVVDAKLSVSRVMDVTKVLQAAAPTILRSVIKEIDHDRLSSDEHLDERLRALLDRASLPWGLTVISVSLRASAKAM